VLLLGIGTAALFLVAILLMWIVLGRLTDAVTTSPAREIAQAVVGPIQASLFGTLIGVLIAGALVALVAYLAGKPAWLTQLFPQNPTRTRGRMSWRS
jgi:small-conductance mechanosensitive channel